MAYHLLFCFVMMNQTSHLCTNLVHKFFCIQSIVGQPLSYFERLVFKKNLFGVDAKQKSKHRTWFTLTIKALNGFLYHVIFSKVLTSYALFFFV